MRAPGLAVTGVLSAVLVLTACAAQGGTSPRQRASDGTSQHRSAGVLIHGTVTSGPTCPVEPVGSPCPPQPAVNVLVAVLRGRSVVATTTTDGQGGYVIRVPIGQYDVRATMQGGYQSAVTRHVNASAHVTVDLLLDSGIRGPGKAT